MATVIVGGISFDTIEGFPQSAISSTQIFNLYQNSFVVGLKEAPDFNDGKTSLRVQVRKVDESTCAHLSNLCRALVGITVSVQLDPGAVVANQFVLGVDCSWKKVSGFGSSLSYLFTATWQVVPIEDKPLISLAEVYTSPKWGNWKPQPQLFCMEASEGLGVYAGEAELVQKIGNVATITEEPADIIGQYVEIRARETPSTLSKPIWWGRVIKQEIVRTAAGGEVRFVCAGLAELLRQSVLTKWYEQYFLLDGVTSKTSDPGSLLPFNEKPIGNKCGSANQTIGTSLTRQTLNTWMHNRSLVPHSKWTALDAMQSIIAAFNDQYPFGPIWRLTGQTDALKYDMSEDLEFHTVLDIVRALATPSRGITFALQVPLTADTANNNQNKSDIYCNINISTGLSGVLTIADTTSTPATEPVTFPAALQQTAIDFSLKDIIQWEYSADYSEVYDAIYVQGERPLWITSAGYDDSLWDTEAATGTGQLTKGWTAAQETAWEAANDDGKSSPELAHVWRRFALKPLFWGHVYNKDGNADTSVPFKRFVDSFGNETGEWTVDETNNAPTSGETWRIERSLPVNSEQKLETISGSQSVIDFRKPMARPIMFSDDSGKFTDETSGFEITMADNLSYIDVGRDAQDGINTKAFLTSGKKLVFTFAYEFPQPWRLSWQRAIPTATPQYQSSNPSFQPADMPRSILLKANGQNYRWLKARAGTVGRFDTTSPTLDPVIVPGDVDIYKPGAIYQLLELAKLRYTVPRVRAQWTQAGSLDLSPNYATQTLVTTTTIPYPDSQDKTGVPIYGVISRRRFHFAVGKQAVSYAVEPSLPELNAMGIMQIGYGSSEGF